MILICDVVFERVYKGKNGQVAFYMVTYLSIVTGYLILNIMPGVNILVGNNWRLLN